MPLRLPKPWLLATVTAVILLAAGYLLNLAYQAPDIAFSIIDGRRIQLQDLRGRPVLVQFWATSCPTCREDMPQMVALYHDLHRRGLELIAVAMPYDPPNRVLEMSREKQIPYPVALDVMGRAMDAFGDIEVTPTTLLIAPSGHIVRRHVGKLDFDLLRRQITAMLPAGESLQTGRDNGQDNARTL